MRAPVKVRLVRDAHHAAIRQTVLVKRGAEPLRLGCNALVVVFLPFTALTHGRIRVVFRKKCAEAACAFRLAELLPLLVEVIVFVCRVPVIKTMCVCMHACMYVFMFVCTLCVRMYVGMYVCIMLVCMYICRYVCISQHAYMG
jgi:hypothetical protein